MEEQFIKFLKKHDAYEKFMYNLLAEKWYELDELYKIIPIHKWIDCAFEWIETSEGYDYWNALDGLWCDVVYDTMI